jgi:hypothetical protein
MAGQHLDDLEPVDRLYDYRGRVPAWLPYQQGDVFSDVSMPGRDVGPAMLFLHPCTMRQGTRLRDRLTVVRVTTESTRKVLDDAARWAGRNKVMPLPDLLADQTSTHVADFMEIATVTADQLPRSSRIAQLSLRGRLQMQQRIVFHLTRYAPMLDDLELATESVELEAQQQADWVQAGCGCDDLAAPDRVDWLEAEYQAYLGGTDSESIRTMLYGPASSQAVRRIQQEIALRYPRGTA